MTSDKRFAFISLREQSLSCYENDQRVACYQVSTGRNGAGEQMDSGCTPRGWHRVHAIIGSEQAIYSVFRARQWTGEIYTPALAAKEPGRDWILSRIIQLDGLEPGRNQGGSVDTLKRYIYIHGTAEENLLGKPGSHGCIRVSNAEIIKLADWLRIDTAVCIE